MKQYDKIEAQIKKILEAMLTEAAMPKWLNPEWTRQIANRICKLGKKLGYSVYSSTEKEEDQKGWLYDVTWLKHNKNGSIVYSPLILESEWGTFDEIRDDFAKLLLSRAKHRVMIFEQKPKKDIIKSLMEEVEKFSGSQKGDRYFFAGYDLKTDKFEFDLLVL